MVARLLANVTVYSWSTKWKPTKCLETGWRVLARPVSLAFLEGAKLGLALKNGNWVLTHLPAEPRSAAPGAALVPDRRVTASWPL